MRKLQLVGILICLSIAPASVFAQKIIKESINSEGKKRTYYLYVPSSVKPPTAAPLIVLLHGSNRNGLSLVEKWRDLADKGAVVLLGPDSIDSSIWSVPRDGPAFLHNLIESIKGKYPINARRVYLFGHSGGATFALMQSLYESEYFASSAIHAGALYQESALLVDLAKRKIPIYLTVGTVDPLFPVATVRATRDLLAAKGFPVVLAEIPGHGHWYYDLAPKINEAAWQFLKSHELPVEPSYAEYNFRSDDKGSRAAIEQYNQGMKLQSSGDAAGAIAAYTRAIELDRKYAAAYNNRAIAQVSRNEYAGALADFTRSIELEPSEVTYGNRAGVYVALKKYAEGIADLSAAIELKPTAPAYANRGLVYEQSGQGTLALADYDSAIKLDPNFGRAYLLRGLSLIRAGKPAEATADFDKGFKLNPQLHAEFDAIIKQYRP